MAGPIWNRFRLVVSDVDGTIVSADKSVLPATVAAAKRLRDAGIPLAVVSSRPPRGMTYVKDALGVDGPIGAFNGGYIANGDQIIANHLIAEGAVRLFLDFLAAKKIDAWLFADDQWLLKDPNGVHTETEKRAVKFDPVVVDDFTPYIARCGKVVGVSDDHALIEKCEEELEPQLKGRANAHRSQKYYLDLTHPDANKGAAVRAIANWYKVSLEQVAVIGDMSNDVPMFDVAGFSIAMGNAPDAVAAKASARAGPNTESGWADAIDHYVLGRTA